MGTREFVLDGEAFHDYEGFCRHFSDRVLSGLIDWRGNLDALADLLLGGFGEIDYDTPYTIIWRNSERSRTALGRQATIDKLREMMRGCHATNLESLRCQMLSVERGQGTVLFDWIVEIIRRSPNVTLRFR